MRRRERHVLGVAVLSLCGLAGCAVAEPIRVGARIDVTRLTKIIPGHTRAEDLAELLGEPTMVQTRSSGRRLLVWRTLEITTRQDLWKLWNNRVRTEERNLSVQVFVEGDRVLDYTVTESRKEADEPVPPQIPQFIFLPLPTS
jgi:type IV pilus biogenesis protein CpaD/CtpE